jgi:N-formylglutamate amidohydrolase
MMLNEMKVIQYPWFLLFGFLTLFSLVFTQCDEVDDQNSETIPGQEFEISDMVKVSTGDIPLIISAPHGGTLTPNEIPDRSCSGITTVRDMNTTELADEIKFQMKQDYGVEPYVISSLIHRKKIDLNRDAELATCGNSVAKEVWEEYHRNIEEAIQNAISEFGGAIFVDLHGHGHDIQRLELGYLLKNEELRESYEGSDETNLLAEKSSLKNLMTAYPELEFQDLLTGENAFGTIMETEGVPAVPSMQDPFPYPNDAYFTGGYNTRRYTSDDYPDVFGWQIEANYDGVRDSDENRSAFAEAFSKAIMVQLEEYVF